MAAAPLRWRAMRLAFMEADSSSASAPRETASDGGGGGGGGGRTLGTGTCTVASSLRVSARKSRSDATS